VASHNAKIVDVTDRHRYRAITPRLPDALRAKVYRGVADTGTNVSAVVIALLRWWVGETDELPQRPPRRPDDDPCRAAIRKLPPMR
jgi:hypothetical protein